MSRKMFGIIRDTVRAVLIILIFSTISIFWYINQQRDYYQQYDAHATELRVLTQSVIKFVSDAVTKQDDADFQNLISANTKIDKEIDILTNGISINGNFSLPPSPEKIKTKELKSFVDMWVMVRPNINAIVQDQKTIVGFRQLNSRVFENAAKLKDLYWKIIYTLGAQTIDNGKKIIAIAHQIDSLEVIINDLHEIISIVENNVKTKNDFVVRTTTFFKEASDIAAANQDSAFAPELAEIEKYLKPLQEDIEKVVNVNTQIDKIQAAMLSIVNFSQVFYNLTKNLETAYVSYPKTNTTPQFFAYGLGLLSFLVLLLSIYLFHKEDEFHLKATEEKNTLMQLEIQNLLQELPEIASGNVPANHNDEIAKAKLDHTLPDSFYYALNALRVLVYNIGKTAQEVSGAASNAQKITKELAASSSNQAQEIVEVTGSVRSMATSIEQVSANATESASVALESVNIASEGGKVVRTTISGMERIQTQIQETSNYMRRLSDSSQEIGEIVSLIDGIADQTNILSLNASIQAAMAGEAGRGFAVVADEVQRLSEKVSYATKEIGSLVRSIQTDTSQVIGAMEQTKAQVLEGVNSAQEAGLTLEQIETVSRRLSDLIQNISLSASEQAEVSGKISKIMDDIKGIAQQTASGTVTTVDLIGNLLQSVTELRNSVLEFKLPGDSSSNKTTRT